MSQVLLGVRNLSVRIAIFVVLAAILVWFLGGSLFPRADEIVRGTVDVGRAGEGAGRVRLIEVVHPRSTLPSERVTFAVEAEGEGIASTLGDGFERCTTLPTIVEAGSLVSVADPSAYRTAYFVARHAGSDAWNLYEIGGYEGCPRALHAYPDRFDAERQIARVQAGLSVQDPAAAAAARDGALRAGDTSAP
ncbi:MAG: hypothetical protein RL591_2453 [Planctomycetota bacterium]